MAQIGYGYGSEFHLMRFLGHHRNLFENSIRNVLKANSNDSFEWLDFDFAKSPKIISGDKEIQGIDFLKGKFGIDNNILFSDYPWNRSQSWDAIFRLGGTVYFVEAKAHIEELKSSGCKASNTKRILSFMEKSMTNYSNVQVNDKWLGDYYQLANRLSTVCYLNNLISNIHFEVFYIYFENGFYGASSDKKEFQEEIRKEKMTLGILGNESIEKLIHEMFIDAKTGALHA